MKTLTALPSYFLYDQLYHPYALPEPQDLEQHWGVTEIAVVVLGEEVFIIIQKDSTGTFIEGDETDHETRLWRIATGVSEEDVRGEVNAMLKPFGLRIQGGAL